MTRRRRRSSQRSIVSSLPHLLSRISSLIGSYSVSWALLLYVPEATTSFSTSKQAVHVPISRRISAPRLALSRAARIPREEDDDYYFDENDDDFDETFFDGPRVSSSSAKFVEWKNTGQRSPQSLTPPSSQERSLPIANRLGLVDPWMVESAVDDDDDDENDEEYNSSLQQKRRRSSAAPSQTLADTEAYASDVGRPNYMDDYERSEDDYSTFKEPGNFWSNPVQRPDSGPPVALPSNSKHPTTTRPRPTADPDALLVPRQRQRSRRAATTFRSGTPPPPKPLADLYHRLFWYGLETDEDLSSSSQEESRTMFGGTKGKFNGLSYLYNGQAVVPPEQRRAVPPRNEQNRPGRAFLSSNEYYDDEYDDGAGPYAYNDDEDYDDPRQPMPPRKYFSVTPPNDPPRPMWERRNNNYQRRERSAVASWWDDDDVDVNGDIKFDRNDEVRYDQDFVDKSDRTGRRSKRQRTVDNKANWANALESFLGLDRERLRDQAAAYDQRIHKRNSQYRRTRSLDEPQPPPPFRGQQRRNGYLDDERYGEVDENFGLAPPSTTTKPPPGTQRQPFQQIIPSADTRIIDADHLMDKDQPSSDTLQASQKVPAASQPPLQSLLTWEERALAVERVPPANVPAWGPTGDLGMDARTKALQDALQDIAAAKQIVEERRHRVTMAQEQMAVLRVDAQIERQRLMKMKNSMRNDMYADERTTLAAAREALRWTQRRIEESSRRLRWRQLQWDEAVEELAHVEARHWALLKAYDPAKAHQVVQDAWQELEQLEPVVARYNEKLKSRQQEQSGGESGPNSPETTASGSSSPSL